MILTRTARHLEVFIDSIKITEEIQQNLATQLSGNVTWYSYEEVYGRVQYYVRKEI